MKLNKFTIIGILFLAILTLGAVNAVENTTTDDLAISSDDDLKISSSNEVLNDNRDIAGDGTSDEILSSEKETAEEMNTLSQVDDNIVSSEDVSIDIKVINDSKVDISIPNATGNVIVIIDNNETSMPLNSQGMATVLLNNLSAGDHSIVVVYEGDGAHAVAHCTTKFNIPDKGIHPIASDFSDIVIGDDLTVSLVLKDQKGNVIANAPIRYSIDGVNGTKFTDNGGVLVVAGKEGAVININYDGNEAILGTYVTVKLNYDVAPPVKVSTMFNISGGVITINGYAVDTKAGEEGIYYATELLDADGNPIGGVPINFAVNNKIYDRTTYENGSFDPYKLNMVRAGRYTLAFYFAGNEVYTSTFAAVCVDLDKKPITIKASSKSYKASATKKYTVTLSTIVGSSHNGKAHLSPKEVKLTVNGKTYAGKTDGDGKVTFKITNLSKKGKYTAKISYDGDSTYESATKSVKITIK